MTTDDIPTVSHSGDFGDTIASCAGLQTGLYDLVLYPASITGNRMTPERAKSLASLLSYQPYINSVRWNAEPVGVDLDGWRNHYNGSLNLADMCCDWWGVPRAHRCHPWLVVPKKQEVAPVVISRSPRYQNRRFPWSQIAHQYSDVAVFVGTREEHAAFCELTKTYIRYHQTTDMMDLAQVIAGAKLHICNQSSPRWVAEGLKVPVCVEQFWSCPNTHWDRPGAVYGNAAHGSCVVPGVDVHASWLRSIVSVARDRTLLTDDRLQVIASHADQLRHVEGDFAECGVWKGGVCRMMASIAPEKTVHAYDTWAGIPEDDTHPNGHKKGEFHADLEETRRYLAGTRVEFHPGIFPETAVEARFALVHLDLDTYKATKAALEWLWPRMVPEGVIVLDDYGWHRCLGVELAVTQLLPDVQVEVTAPQQAVIRKETN